MKGIVDIYVRDVYDLLTEAPVVLQKTFNIY